MSLKSAALAIIVVLAILGMSTMSIVPIKNGGIEADRSSIGSAVSDFYVNKNGYPEKKEAISAVKNTKIQNLYKALVSKLGKEYVDKNMYIIDTSALKNAQSLQRLVNNKRLWIGDKLNPSTILTEGDEKLKDIMAGVIKGGDKTLAERTQTVIKSSTVSDVTASSQFNANSVVIGGSSGVANISWDSVMRKSEKNLTSLFPTIATPTYISSPENTVNIMDSNKKINKGSGN